MDFDPNAASGEWKRSGPRWYSVIAFLVIAFLLLLNAIAMFVNAEANEEQACYAMYAATGQMLQAAAGAANWNATAKVLASMVEDCTGVEDTDE